MSSLTCASGELVFCRTFSNFFKMDQDRQGKTDRFRKFGESRKVIPPILWNTTIRPRLRIGR